MGVPWQAIGASVGSRATATAQAGALRRQNRILGEGARLQNRAGMEATANFADFLDQLRGNRVNPAVEQSMFADALGAGSVNVLPTASGAARGDAAAQTGATRGYGGNLAALLARIRAPQLEEQRTNEAFMRMGNRMRPIQMRAQDNEFLTNLRAGLQQPNRFLTGVGTLLGGGGKSG